MVNLAMVGLGYWGPNLVRNFASLEGAKISMLCDVEVQKAVKIRQKFCPGAEIVQNYEDLARNDIDAVVLATPIQGHYKLGQFFLSAGKHVLMEKPLAKTTEQCIKLIDLADRNNLVLMVGHVFEYNAAVRRIKEYLDAGELGKLFYVYSQRLNLGRIQNDLNALWSFAPHDFSIINYWLGEEPSSVSAKGLSYLSKGIEDVVFVTVEYPSGVCAHLHLAWLDPRKIRLMTLVGSKKMLVYDDVSMDAKIQLYDKGIRGLHEFLTSSESFAEFQFQIRSGDLVIPRIRFDEPLQTECQHFIDCIMKGQRPITDGNSGLSVVKSLEAAERSLRTGGITVAV